MIVCPCCGNFSNEDNCEVCGMRLSIDERFRKEKKDPDSKDSNSGL